MATVKEIMKKYGCTKEQAKCKHVNWRYKSFLKVTGGTTVQERECLDCNLVIAF